MSDLPPDPLPPLPDPAYGNVPGPYSRSGLREVCGTRIASAAFYYYRRRNVLLAPESIRTCGHPQIEAWVGQVAGFDPHSRITQPKLKDWPMTGIIPRLSIWGDSLPFEVPQATYSIDYSYLHSSPTTMPERETAYGLRERFPEGSKLLLAFFNSRPQVIALWSLMEFWGHRFLDQFDAVLLPDFSAFSNDPMPQYLVGERQMQIFGEEGSAAGRNVIPTIAWPTFEALRRQIETYASSYPQINTIHLDCHGSHVNRTGWVWHWLFAMEEYCAHYPNIRWLISGMTQGWAIRELNRIFPNKNYALMPSPSMMVSVLSGGSRDPAWQADQFRSKIARLEDLRSGREVAEAMERPDHWLSFEELDVDGLSGRGPVVAP